MNNTSKNSWKEKTAGLIKKSFSKHSNTCNHGSLAMEAARLAGASAALLITINGSERAYIESGFDPNHIGKSISTDSLNYIDLPSITLKKSTKNSPDFLSSSYNLSIPLKFKKSFKLLILGFEKLPTDKKGLIQYAEIVQSLLLAVINNLSHQPTYKGHDLTINSEQKANFILQNLQELFWSINSDHKITCISPILQNKIYEETGLTLHVGSTMPTHIFSKLFLSNCEELFEKAFNGQKLMLRSQRAPNDIKVCYDFNIIPIKNNKNETIEVAVTGKTIPSKEHYNSISLQKNSVLMGIISHLPVIIYRIDTNGNFLELTGAGLRKLNIQNNEMVGKKALEIFPDLKKFIPAINTDLSQRLVIKGALDNDPLVFINYTIPDQSSEGGIVGFAIDVTEQDCIEQELKKSKELAEKANQAKSHFLANQSHEIRTPINAILGFAQLMKTNLYSSESEEYLDYILSSGQTLLNLIGNVLDLTKIEEGKLDLVEEPFHMQEAITSKLHPYLFQAKEKGLDIILEFDANLPKYILGDAGKIVQIIINLLGNSLKFTKEGSIKIHLKSMCPAVEGENTIIQISVSDTGIGIPFEKQQTIFESFTQADASINRQYGGSGLGLSIVKALTNLMNGKLEVKSPGELESPHGNNGTTILINFPLRVAFPPSVEIHEHEKEINYNGQLKILLVDDNYLNLRLASTMLNNLGCKVTITHNGREAIKELVQHNFDLIFMDVQMPVLDGYETTRLIRNKLKLDIPIIGLSANVYKEDIDLCYESGMDDYLSRPYTIKSFHEKVFKWATPLYSDQYDKRQNDAETTFNQRLTQLTFIEQLFNGDKEKVIETVKDFILHNDKMIHTLGQAIAQKDFRKIASVAHNIRSSLQTVGLDCLYELMTDIELISKGTKNVTLLEKYFLAVKEISQRANIELKESLMIRQR